MGKYVARTLVPVAEATRGAAPVGGCL